MNNILITGITGFTGSHIAETLVKNNFKVIGLKRTNSNIWRCESYKKKIIWINIDSPKSYKKLLIRYGFDILIHCAWIGVESSERDYWELQSQNFLLLSELLEVSKQVSVKKIIVLGSQSEYGRFDGKISELNNVNPNNAYAAVKISCLELIKTFATINNIEWLWLRLFSLFGEKESNNWLIPSIINSIIKNQKIQLTLGEQRYSYLYVKDLSLILLKIVEAKLTSGVYNISSNLPRSIKSIVTEIKDRIDPNYKLEFGNLEYRKNQSMHIEGDISKLVSQIGEIKFTDFEIAIQNTINFYSNTN